LSTQSGIVSIDVSTILSLSICSLLPTRSLLLLFRWVEWYFAYVLHLQINFKIIRIKNKNRD
jgi:hypothetical protein